MHTHPFNVDLPEGWTENISTDENVSVIYARTTPPGRGTLQVFPADYLRGTVNGLTQSALCKIAKIFGMEAGHGEPTGEERGTCRLGEYGSAIFVPGDFERVQVWALSDGNDYVIAAYVCDTIPENRDMDEARSIIHSLTFKSDKA